MKWTEAHLKALLEQGKIRGYRFNDKPSKPQDSGKATKSKCPSKYGNKKIEYDGHVFDSTKEYNRYRELLLLLKAGEIGQLRLQVEYELNEGGTYSYKYIADFVYIDKVKGLIVEDTKGFRTAVYKKKNRLMKKLFNITIKET